MRFSTILWQACLSASVFIGSMTLNMAQAATTTTTINNTTNTQLKQERDWYAQAQKALAKKNKTEYQRLIAKLKKYPLLPYLEYQDLTDRLFSLPTQEIADFFQHYPDSFLAERMTHRWLRTLAQRERWADYRHFYDSRLTDPELACLQIRARLETGDKSALEDVAPLWNIDKTQSKACDPVFAEWKKAGKMTPTIIWDRHRKAVAASDRNMMAYLANILPANERPLALLYQQVAANPKLLQQKARFSKQSPQMREVILYGLEKYARQDARTALSLWHSYDAQQLFTDEQRLNMKYQIALRLLYQDHEAEAEQLTAATPELTRVDLIEWLIRESLRKQDWEKTNEWLTRLPSEAKTSERWRYWQARTMEQLRIKEVNGETPSSIYADIAPARSFYGFLAADKTGIDYHLLDKPLAFTDEQMAVVEQSPGVQRAREFFMRGDLSSASREWYYSTRKMPSEQIVIAGRLAQRWGWYRHGIQAMIDANYWDDLEVRFPIVYGDYISKAAKHSSVNPLFIYAVTRQESAFNQEARSPAGAMGLMQLLPSTAQQTAKKNGLHFQTQDLLTAEKNLRLGSHYLDQLLNSFSGNRILAAAAYNAGPSRVKRWLNKDKDAQLPYDVWIETIPYKETRGYVQNILSFSVIYAYRLGEKTSFVSQAEALQQL